jgi:arsenate reductase (thioredoxin)
MKKVLVLCTGNSCRSIMAEALINEFLSNKWKAFSAGTNPSQVNPRAIQVMQEIGIDISTYRSKSVFEYLNWDDIDLVITVCDDAKETCPVFLKKVKQIHISIKDPAPYTDEPGEIALPIFRKTRDEIRQTIVETLTKQNSDS